MNQKFKENAKDLLLGNKKIKLNFVVGSTIALITHILLWVLYSMGMFNILVLILVVMLDSFTYINIFSLIAKYDALKVEVSKDPLTKIYNRQYFFDILDREVSRAKRKDFNLVMAMFDLDDFKKINDTYGHYAGDQVLIGVTQIVQRIVRQYDIFGRIGGEEFAIIFPEINEQDAFDLCERIRVKIQESSLNKKIPITISVGMVKLSQEDDSYDLYQKSDRAMYQAKDNGKNQTILFK